MGKDGPRSPITRVVLMALFLRFDWSNPQACFEGVRSLAVRTGLSKDSVARHLRLAVEAGWLSRAPRAAKGSRNRAGYTYDIRFPSLRVSVPIRHKTARGENLRLIRTASVSDTNGPRVCSERPSCPMGSDRFSSESPLNPLTTPGATRPALEGAARAPDKQEAALTMAGIRERQVAERKQEVLRGTET